jgi:hypothetical protein
VICSTVRLLALVVRPVSVSPRSGLPGCKATSAVAAPTSSTGPAAPSATAPGTPLTTVASTSTHAAMPIPSSLMKKQALLLSQLVFGIAARVRWAQVSTEINQAQRETSIAEPRPRGAPRRLCDLCRTQAKRYDSAIRIRLDYFDGVPVLSDDEIRRLRFLGR